MGVAMLVSFVMRRNVVIRTVFVAVAMTMIVACLRNLAMGSTASFVFSSSVHLFLQLL